MVLYYNNSTLLPYNQRYGTPLVTGIGKNYSVNKVNGCGYKYNGITGGTAIIKGKGAMPTKFYPSVGSSMFSSARQTFIQDAGGGQSWYDSSQYIHLKKINAIGKSSRGCTYNKQGICQPNALAFSSMNKNDVKNALSRTRSGGCVAPPKKALYGLPISSPSSPGCC